ncbi:MAG: hypothetical protein IBX50_17580, partial [Marinospirillum sp.]|uniref:hypothetical protein n=1 Tax=Marinospirillum sp. TaxID=2183934 RepID=UPI0019FCB8D8
MSAEPIENLSPVQALVQAIKATRLLLDEIGKMTAAEADNAEKTEKLAKIRDQLVHQVFSKSWTEAEVQQHLSELQTLETLDTELQDKAMEIRTSLHQMRADNQHNRKAVNAYGQAKGQF